MYDMAIEQQGNEFVATITRLGRFICEGRGPTEAYAEEVARLELADYRSSKQ